MSRNHDEETAQVYYIPANYDESGGVLGGRIGTRNAVELVVFCGPLVYAEYHLLRFSIQTNLIIALVTILPVAFLCVFGVGGETISQLLIALIRHVRRKRVLHYDMFTPAVNDERRGFSIDKFLDIAASSGIKAAIAKFQEERMETESESGSRSSHTKKQKPRRHLLARRERNAIDDDEREIKASLRRQERAIRGQTRGWLSAARKDKGHRALNNPAGKRAKD